MVAQVVGPNGPITARDLRRGPETRAMLRTLQRRARRSGTLSPLGYNLTISHDHRFMWFRVAKVGTRTIFGYLDEHGINPDIPNAARMRYPVDLFEDYFKFAFVRHPLTRFVSAWQDKVVGSNHFKFDDGTLARMQTIENFVAWVAEKDLSDPYATDRHVVLQTRMVDLTQIDFLGRLEAFDSDFGEVCRRLSLPVASPERRNVSRPERPEPSAELVSAVEELYRRDYQILGY